MRMRILDRYVIREIIPPFLIALLVFTFILIIPFIIELAEQMIAKGVPWATLLQLMGTLLPGGAALTIPLARARSPARNSQASHEASPRASA